MATYDAGTIKATVDANTRPYTSAMLRAAATTKAATRMMSGDADRASHSFDDLSDSAKAASQQIFNLSAVTMNLAVGGIASLVQPAAGAIDALSGGAIIAAKSLSDLQGAVVALPVGLSALAQGFGAVKFATMGLGDAVKAYAEGDSEAIKEALKGTSEEAGKFAKALVDLQPKIEKIRDAAADEFFPGLTRGMKEATANLPALQNAMVDTAAVMGDLAQKAGEFIGSRAFGERFGVITRRNADLLSTAGDTALELADAFTVVLVKAKPLTDYMGVLIDDMGTWARATAYASAETGELTDYFDRARDSFEQWSNIITNTAGMLKELFAGAAPYAEQFRGWLETTTRGWQLWSRSAEGTADIEAFFERIQGPLRATGKLFGDLVRVIWDLGNTDTAMDSYTQFAETLRTQLLPALLDLATGVGPEMATNLALLATAIAKLLDVASFNPLLALVGAVSKLAIAFTDLLDTVPILSEVAGAITAVYLTTRLFNMTAFIGKMGGITQGLKALVAAGGAAAAANTTVATTAAATTVATNAEAAATERLVMSGRSWATTGTGLVVPANTAVTTSATTAAAAQGRLAVATSRVNGFFAKMGPLGKTLGLAAVAYGVTEIAGQLGDFNRYADDAIDNTDMLRTQLKMWGEQGTPEVDGWIALEHALGNVLRVFDGDWDDAWRATARRMAEIDADIAAGIQQGGQTMKVALETYQGLLDQAAAMAEPKLVSVEGQGMWATEMETQAQAAARAMDELKAKFPETAQAIEEFKATHYDMSDTLMLSTTRAQDLYMAVNTLGDRYASAGEKANAFKDALYTLTGAIDSQLDRAIAGADAAREFRKQINELKNSGDLANVTFDKNGRILARGTKGAYEGAKAAQTLRNSILDKVAATYEETRSVAAAMRKYRALRSDLIKNHDEYDISRSKAKELAKALLGVPNKVKTALQVDPKGFIEALNKTGSVKKALQEVTREKGEAKVKVDGAEEAKGVIGRIHDQVMAFVKKNYTAHVTVTGAVDPSTDQYLFRKANGSTVPLGSIQSYATGGQVFGAGTKTSDSIPAWLSNGEFVISADAVRKYGTEMFEMLNAQRFAAGGVVVSSPSGGSKAAMTKEEQKALYERLFKQYFKSFDDPSTKKDDAKAEERARKAANRDLERIMRRANRDLQRSLNQVVKSMEQAAKAALKAAVQAFNQRVQSIKQGVQDFGSITQTGGTEYLSGAGLVEEMKARADLAKQFKQQYLALEKAGLNQKSLKEILAAGPQEGSKIAAALLEGPRRAVSGRIDEINALEKQLARIGKSLGTEAAVNEGLRADIREARTNLQAVQSTEITVSEGAVKVSLDLSGVDKQDRQKIRETVDRSVNQAFREFIRELRRNG